MGRVTTGPLVATLWLFALGIVGQWGGELALDALQELVLPDLSALQRFYLGTGVLLFSAIPGLFFLRYLYSSGDLRLRHDEEELDQIAAATTTSSKKPSSQTK